MNLTEDDVYRTSTQYRLWSFTSEALASIRRATNRQAADHVRAAIRRAQEGRTAGRAASAVRSGEGEKDGIGKDDENGEGPQVQCLTVEEEQKLVGFYCVKAMELADFCNFRTNVKVKMCLSSSGTFNTEHKHRQRPFNISNAFTCSTPQ